MRQMDVLMERIMETEAAMAQERNNALEYESNCTELGRQIAALHRELSDWQNRCAEFADAHKKNEVAIKELKKSLKDARTEAENLAISIENSRIRDHMDDSRRKKKKTRGLLGWIFSLIVSPSESDIEAEEDSPQVSFESSEAFLISLSLFCLKHFNVSFLFRVQDLAKSTLLRALQIERANVDELEAVVTSLQQNNSAIAEMVKSRDLIIDELNDRVAVFEEDKVVL